MRQPLGEVSEEGERANIDLFRQEPHIVDEPNRLVHQFGGLVALSGQCDASTIQKVPATKAPSSRLAPV